MSSEANKEVISRLFEECWNQGNTRVVDELCDPDAIQFDPTYPEGLDNAGFKQFLTTYRTAFPDVRMTISDLIGEDDTVAVSWSAMGTHRGELMGIPPTGKQVTVEGISIYQFANDQIVSSNTSWDLYGMLQQLGAIPQSQQQSKEIGQ